MADAGPSLKELVFRLTSPDICVTTTLESFKPKGGACTKECLCRCKIKTQYYKQKPSRNTRDIRIFIDNFVYLSWMNLIM
jgi:hypothetical protein